RHRDLGFVVDLGGVKAAANPLGIPLSGVAAGAVTRGYHLAAMPGNRVRVAADWLLDAVLPRQAVQLGLVRSWSVPLDTASPELARVPGNPEKARAGNPGPAGGSRAGEGAEPADAIQDADAGKHAEPPGPLKEPDLIQDADAAKHAEPPGPVKEPDLIHDADADADADVAKHAEPPGPVKQPDLIQASERTPSAASSDAPAVHKHRPRDPSTLAPPEPGSPASSEGDS
ncbi:dehydrogenase, partial [Streptomyces chartreusis]